MSANIFSPDYFYSLLVSAVLDHFGYPAPHLGQWQQRVWYDLGATQEVLHQMRIRLSRAFPRSPVPQGPSHLLPLAGQLQRRSILFMRRDSLRPQKVELSPQHREHWAIPACSDYFPKTEIKKKRKRKSVKTHCYQ